ncbi:MAG: HAD-IA family hydrolase [Defluviitaleaceae bacterium]|nr:HAD-IA family hydrolase [Defluviitaleaceae bacterium]
MIKQIIFDVMGVVFTEGDDVGGLLVPYIQSIKPGVTAEKINELYLAASLGKISSHEFWARAGFEQNAIAETERIYLETSFALDAEFVPFAMALKGRCGIALLSNDVSEWSAYLRKFFQLEHLIGRAFISGDLGFRKPDPRIFFAALEGLRAEPHECIFIDDRTANVEAASKLGIYSCLYDKTRGCNFEQIEKKLP